MATSYNRDLTFYGIHLHKKSETAKVLIFILLVSLALLTKYSAVVLLPLWLTILFIAEVQNRSTMFAHQLLKYVVIALLIGITIWMAYGFNVGSLREMTYNHPGRIQKIEDARTEISASLGGQSLAVEAYDLVVNKIKWPAPQYVNGFNENVIQHNQAGHRAFLFGQESYDGWWYYFIAVFLLKETIVVVALTLTFMVYCGLRLVKRDRRFINKVKLNLPFILVPIFFVVISSMSSLNLGVRHLLPVLPFIYIGVSWMLIESFKTLKIKLTYLVVVPILIGCSVLLQYPHYIGYFNELAYPSHHADRYLRGSNFDWGQNEILAEKHLSDIDNNINVEANWFVSDKYILISKRILTSPHEQSVFPFVKQLNTQYQEGSITPIKEPFGTHLLFNKEELEQMTVD